MMKAEAPMVLRPFLFSAWLLTLRRRLSMRQRKRPKASKVTRKRMAFTFLSCPTIERQIAALGRLQRRPVARFVKTA